MVSIRGIFTLIQLSHQSDHERILGDIRSLLYGREPNIYFFYLNIYTNGIIYKDAQGGFRIW